MENNLISILSQSLKLCFADFLKDSNENSSLLLNFKF